MQKLQKLTSPFVDKNATQKWLVRFLLYATQY